MAVSEDPWTYEAYVRGSKGEFSVEAPKGAPAASEKVSVWAGVSASVAVLVKVSHAPSSRVKFVMVARTGAWRLPPMRLFVPGVAVVVGVAPGLAAGCTAVPVTPPALGVGVGTVPGWLACKVRT